MNYVARYVLRRPTTVRLALARLIPPVMLMSAFMSNTAIVGILAPVVQHWARECRLPARVLLLPLNYATIFGGMLSLIGTSTNLIATSYAAQESNEQFHNFGFFTIGYVGLPCCIIAYVYLIIMAPIILREKEENVARKGRGSHHSSSNYFVTSVQITNLSSSKKTAESEGFCDCDALKLIELLRLEEDEKKGPRTVSVESFVEIEPTESLESSRYMVFTDDAENIPLQIGDILVFQGPCDEMATSLFRNSNLVPVGSRQSAKLESSYKKRRLITVVIAIGSTLEGETVASIRFRQNYAAVVLAVHRQFSTLTNDLRDIQLQPGDALLLEASEGFVKKHLHDPAFISIMTLDGDLMSVLPSHRPGDALIAANTLLMIIVTVSTGVLELPIACLLGVFISLFTRVISQKEVLQSISGRTLVIIGCGFGLAIVLQKTGTSKILADGLTNLGSYFFTLVVIFFLTAICSNIISPPATVLLLFSVVFSIPNTTADHHVQKALGVLMIAASCSIVSPYSYQTNLIIMEIGGYEPKDFVMLGGPLVFLTGLVTCVLARWAVWGGGTFV
uniref:RCK C-terminal domain-containing protein n=1 Tax=Lotharella oceanica TaxID=641309 RepID=A0A7S2TQP7_9EUKA|mmetsp:Transcript_23637/g.44141  ORF Transcript_23637/g.44141 Transcript_23637/m.44141 type:complete len:562 (+) Transcript_23637:544-2229(+)